MRPRTATLGQTLVEENVAYLAGLLVWFSYSRKGEYLVPERNKWLGNPCILYYDW